MSPLGHVEFIPADFPPSAEDALKIKPCDIIIDCTADDGLIRELERFPWADSKKFISLSLGYGARRLFCFTANATAFPSDRFYQAIGPWLRQEREERATDELPREGIGCWHPVFPARIDDVWMMAAAAVKFLESTFGEQNADPRLTVFEQQYEAGVFSGIRRMSSESPIGG